jgi:hypothetical protein
MASEEEKQKYLRENIIEKELDADKFITFLESKRENGAQVSSWEMEELQEMVQTFIDQENKGLEPQPPVEEEQEGEEPKAENVEEKKEEDKEKIDKGKKEKKKEEEKEEEDDDDSSSDSSSSSSDDEDEDEDEKKEGMEEKVKAKMQDFSDDEDIDLDDAGSLGSDGKKMIVEDDKKNKKYYNKKQVAKYVKTVLVTDEEISVTVSNPEVIKGKGLKKKYTAYTIKTDYFSWLVKRRYSDFDWLHECLIKRFPANYVSSL